MNNKLISFKTAYLLISCFFINFSFALNNFQKPLQYETPTFPGIIKGQIKNESNGEALEFATVVIYKAKDSTLLTGGITNQKGVFTLTNIPYGKYYLKLNFIGYKSQIINNIEVTQKQPLKKIGIINFKPETHTLNQVNITAEKNMVEYNLDKQVVNVDKNIASSGGTAVDVLQNVPAVTVDFDGNVSLRGNTNITVLIDGKPSALNSSKLQDLQASTIESIEIITNPSAKYNPEGMGGIINVVLKKNQNKGLNATLTTNFGSNLKDYTNNKNNTALNLNYNFGKVNVYGSYSFRYDRMTAHGLTNRTTRNIDSIITLNQNFDTWRKRLSHSITAGADFYLSPKDVVSISVFGNPSNRKGVGTNTYQLFDINEILFNDYIKQSADNENEQNYNARFSYKKSFDKKEKALTFDVVYNYNKEIQTSDMNQEYNLLNYIPNPVSDLYQNNKTIESFNSTNAALNFKNPINQIFKFETGAEATFRKNDDSYTFNNLIKSNWTPDYKINNTFLYDQQIFAAYSILGGNIKKFSFQIGLRLEETFTKLNQQTLNQVFKRDTLDFFPSAHLSYKLSETQDIQISYSRRINRPYQHQLNPFIDYSDPLNLHLGNPYLKPEYINAFELGYLAYINKSSFHASAFYRQINDVIKRYITFDNTNVSRSTFINLSSGISYGLELAFDHQIFKWWKFNLNFSYFTSKIKGDIQSSDMSNQNNSWTSKMNNIITLPGKINIQLTANYRGPMVQPQGEMRPMFMSDIAVKKDLFKEKLSVLVRLSDIFNTQKFVMLGHGDNFDLRFERKRQSRILYFGMTYKISNNNKAKNQKKDREMERQEDYDFE